MSNCGIVPSVDEDNPLYCPDFPKSKYLKVVNRYLALRRGRKILVDQRPRSLLLLSDSSIRSTSSERILGEFLSGNNWFPRPIDGYSDLPPYSFTDPSWSPNRHLHRGPHGTRLKRKSSGTFSDLLAPPKYARSIPSIHDSSFVVEVRRETLGFIGIPSSPEKSPAIGLSGTNNHLPNDVDHLVHQLALALPGIRLEERLRALKSLTPQIITDFLVDHGHLNMHTLDLLRLSNVDRIAFPRSFFNRQNGLNLRGNEIYSVFGKPDAFRTLTRLSFSGTALLDSDIIHFHHLPNLSILLLDEAGIGNEAVFLLVPLKSTLTRLSVAMNPGINNEAVPAILILHRLSFISIQYTGIDMAGLRKIADVVGQEKRVIRIRLPFSCENYIKNVDSKYLLEPKPPLVIHEKNCNLLSIQALKRNLEAHAACNSDILTSGSRLEMVHRLGEILKTRRLDKLVIDLLCPVA